MNKYKDYSAADFAADVDFIKWVKDADQYPENTSFWSAWLANNPDKKGEVQEARRLLGLLKVNLSTDERRTALWDRIEASVKTEKDLGKTVRIESKPFNWSALFKYAAVLLVIATVGAFWYLNRGVQTTEHLASARASVFQNVEEIPKTVLLDDGTSVILYQNTLLEILPEFNKMQRKVKVEGKAYFEVMRDESTPFLVLTQDVTTTVLGTSFLVMAYDHQDITVAVNTGRVAVSKQKEGKASESEVLLTENEAASFVRETNKLTKVDTKNLPLNQDFYKADFHFANEPLTSVFDLIENRYGVKINYDLDKLEQCKLNASLVGIPLEDKIRLICKASNLSYKMNNNEIVIAGDGCSVL